MKIVKKATVTETIDGGTVRQSAWQPMANALVQCEFEAEYPSHLGLAPVFGALGIFLSSKVERIRFSLAPRNISQPGAPAYDQMALNCLEFEGDFLGSDHGGFRNNLGVKPTFDEHGGWEFQFAEATDGFDATPSKLDVQVTAEMITANCICTEAFTVTIMHRPQTFSVPFSVILRDIEGFRQAISDIAGAAYLSKLLRMHGYEIGHNGRTQ
jgi:hypothetical protein